MWLSTDRGGQDCTPVGSRLAHLSLQPCAELQSWETNWKAGDWRDGAPPAVRRATARAMTTGCQIGSHPSSACDRFPFSSDGGDERWWGFDHNDSCFAFIKLVSDEHYDSLASDKSPHPSVSASQLYGEVTRVFSSVNAHTRSSALGCRPTPTSSLTVTKHAHNPHLLGFMSDQAPFLRNPSYRSSWKHIRSPNTCYCQGSVRGKGSPTLHPSHMSW